MDTRDKKLAVLHQLILESDPVSLDDFFAKLEKKPAKRSVRRWLAEMVDEGLIVKLGSTRGTKYQAVQHANSQKVEMSSCFSSKSALVVKKVRQPIYTRSPVAYNEEWLDSYQPNKTFYMPAHFRAQLQKAGKRAEYGDPAGTYAHKIFDRLLIDLSYNSSRLEGNTYSLLDTERLILEGKGAEGKPEEDKIMILNHKEAIRYLVDNAPRLSLAFETICTLHYLLADGLVDARLAGKIRDHGVRIGGSTYLPFEDPKQLMVQLERILKKAALIEDPYEQSLFLLIHISYLQAFTDVNKRTSRLCANIPLIKSNLVPLSFNDVEKEDYTSALIAIYELQDVRPILDLYVFSYLRTCALYDSTVKSIKFDAIRVRYRQERRALLRHVILKNLVGKELKHYISSQASKLVVKKEQKDFVNDVFEDLNEIDLSRIVGLGITPAQLNKWIKRYQKNKIC